MNPYEPKVDVSIVIPVFNERENVGPLYEMLDRVLAPLPKTWEIIFVDDGSDDGTLRELRRMHDIDSRVRCLRFARNCGQTAAMQAGFDHAHGAVIVSMDGDLQNDPSDIPRFLDKIEEGYGIVCGWRKDRKDKTMSRKIPSKVANSVIRAMTGVRIHDTGCSLKAYRAEVIRSAQLYSEMHRFIPAVVSLTGARLAEIVVSHHARRFGRSKYGMSRAWKVMSDLLVIKMITGFSKRPAVLYSLLSLPFLLLGAASLAAAVLLYVDPRPGEEFSIVLPGITILFAFAFLHLLFLGLLTELVVATGRSHESQVLVSELVDE